ncbi:hypothetical protein DVR12_19165 [Chitinophaga silvatica]|uniref:Outer membrane protein beta-barrel domain-containing protein n=1 Tax=Chitinophaga silvatica TaxID=2282649 RepID=A0A3E1Y6Z5_9BACT|nr:hypothetical protein [Chitinophaga silvatica]RFS20681.1 hypothetical protein DVR12_19165 [Chitinophaga silvatica]
MKLLVNVIPFLLLITLSFTLNAQSDSAVQPNPVSKKVANPSHTKVELVYKTYTTNKGYQYLDPYIRTDGANDFPLTQNSPLLRSYFSNCPTALLQLDGYKTNINTFNRWTLGSFGAGGALALTGLILAARQGNSIPTFASFLGTGFGTMIAGAIIRQKYKKQADKNLKEAFRQYNIKCYVPLPKDTTPKEDSSLAKNADLKNESVDNKNKKPKKAPKYYTILRNEPKDLKLWGIEATPVVVDIYSYSPSVGVGLGAFYSFPGNARIRANYEQSLYYLLNDNHRATKPPAGSYASYGIPSNPTNDSRFEVMGSIPVINRESKTDYKVKIARRGDGVLVPTISGNKVVAMNLRAGFIHENRILESISGLPLTTDKPLMTTPGGEPLQRYFGESSVMLNSNIVAGGLGLSLVKDLKIELKDKTLKGYRDISSVVDFYLDVLYAPSMKYSDITYYYPSPNGEQLTENLSVTSPLNKVGARFGFRREGLSKALGTAFGVEMHVKPGPGVSTEERVGVRASFAIILTGRRN